MITKLRARLLPSGAFNSQPIRTVRQRNQHGASLLFFTFAAVLLIVPVIGLAIDGAIGFWVKSKLSAAVDAAALAAGRSPNANANQIAQQYVYANFPIGWMATNYTSAPVATVAYPNQNTRQVTVTASVSVPLYFMPILGFKRSNISTGAAASRRNANVMLVLDRSGSMNITGPDGNLVCNTMIGSATTFVNYFTNGLDQLGLITFHTWPNVDFAFTTNFQSNSPSLTSILSDLVCGANTSSAMALNLAYNQIKQLGSSAYASNGALNVIVFFTDGIPNGITGTFTSKNQSDNRYYANPNYQGNDITSQMDSGMAATTSQCQSSLSSSSLGIVTQGSGGESGAPATGMTEGIFQIPSPTPTSTCASGQARSICNVTRPMLPASGCYFAGSTSYSNNWPVYGHVAVRQDVAYIPTNDYYGNSTNNSSYMTQSGDWVSSGPYANSGFRTDTPQSITDASFNAADAQALAIISDIQFKPVIYTIGLGGASDVPSGAAFQTFLQRVANDPSSNRYNPSLPTGMFVYSPNDTQLAAAFHQVASQILRLSK